MENTVEIGKLAMDTCVWPLYEVEYGKYKMTYKPKEKKPVIEWLKSQARFKHLLKPGNEKLIEQIQANVDKHWNDLLIKCEGGAAQ